MKKRARLAILLSIALLISVTRVVSGEQLNLVKISKATSKSADEAMNWVKSQVGKGIDYDGAYGCQCVDLIKAYYSYLGVNPVGGNGSDYRSNSLPTGWNRIQGAQPQKGDILVYTGGYNGYGHVAIYESDRSHYHQNFDSHSYVERITYMYNGLSTPYWGVIRPNWSSGNNPEACLDVCADCGGKIRVRGWAFDRDNLNTSIDVHIYIGDEGHAITANNESPDVSEVFGITGNHRFDEYITTNKRGLQTVYFHAINIGGGGNVMWDKREITISEPAPAATTSPSPSPSPTVPPSDSPTPTESVEPSSTPGREPEVSDFTVSNIKATTTETNAVLYSYWTNDKEYTLTEAGGILYDENGNKLAERIWTTKPSNAKAFNHTVDINRDMGYVLVPGKKYRFQTVLGFEGKRFHVDIDFVTQMNTTPTSSPAPTYKPSPTATPTPDLSAPSFSLKAKKGAFQVTVIKQAGVEWYDIQFSTKKSMKGATITTIFDDESSKKTVKHLRRKKKYYVRVRSYNGKNSKWSRKKTIKTK